MSYTEACAARLAGCFWWSPKQWQAGGATSVGSPGFLPVTSRPLVPAAWMGATVAFCPSALLLPLRTGQGHWCRSGRWEPQSLPTQQLPCFPWGWISLPGRPLDSPSPPPEQACQQRKRHIDQEEGRISPLPASHFLLAGDCSLQPSGPELEWARGQGT